MILLLYKQKTNNKKLNISYSYTWHIFKNFAETYPFTNPKKTNNNNIAYIKEPLDSGRKNPKNEKIRVYITIKKS